MALTRAGQIVCKADWNDFTAGSNKQPTRWFVDTENGYHGEVHFDEYLLRDYDYYKSYTDDLGKNYFDIRFILEGFEDQPSPYANLSKTGTKSDTEDRYIQNGDIYCIKFKPIKNNKYTQDFSLVLVDSKHKTELVIQSYSIPAKTEPELYEVYFCPESFGLSNNFDEILFRVHRSNMDANNIIMELKSFEMIKLDNILNNFTDEQGHKVTEFTGLEIETVNRGECLLFINFDIFWVGNDKKLKIDEDLEVSIQKLAYIKHVLPKDISMATSDYITCLINYKY